MPRWLRWLLLIVAVAAVGAGLTLWRAHNSGQAAAKADLQEAVSYGHWALQQDSPELFQQHLDGADPDWRTGIMAQFHALVDAASGTDVPRVEDLRLSGTLAEADIRWTDATSGKSYLSRRWYRLIDGEWRWSQPRNEGWTFDRTSDRPHLVLTHAAQDGPIVAPILDNLDGYIARQCERYRLDLADCVFSLRWGLPAETALPFGEQEQALPTLASAKADAIDGAVYLLNVDAAAWESARVREQLARFHPGRVYVAQSRLEMIRPADTSEPPEATLGAPGAPIQLPTPWLRGVTDDGRPHPLWQAQAERAIADAVLRRVHGPILGTVDGVNGSWALHQALLATSQPMPEPRQWPQAEPTVSGPAPPAAVPDLAALGMALQSDPDETALQQLAGLATFLSANWSQDEHALLARALGREVSLDDALTAALGLDEATFLRDWRAAELLRADSPLAAVANALVEHAQQEAQARDRPSGQFRDMTALFTPAGVEWLRRNSRELSFDEVPFGDLWQARVTALGAVDEVVWAEIEETDGSRRVADLRFFRWDDSNGWRRDRPDARFWGEERRLESNLTRWRFGTADEAAVQAAAPAVEALLREVRQDLDLVDAEPIDFVVTTDTFFTADPLAGGALIVPSPRRVLLDEGGDPAASALAEHAGLLLIYVEIMRKAAILNPSDDWFDREWPVLMAVWRAELQKHNFGDIPYFRQADAPIARAVIDGNAPTLADASPGIIPQNTLTGNTLTLLALYVIQEHGQRWLESLLEDGLAPTLESLRAEQGWTEADLEADWHQFLEGRFGGPSAESIRTFARLEV